MQQITQIKKVLVANRGEIAVRIFRACYDLGLHTVAIYSNEDTYSLFRTKADEAYLVGEKKSPLGAYLDIPGIISLARRRGVTAIHPGYGFLSENADFARACEENGILFVGPSSQVLAQMGDKLSAKEIAVKCGVPIIPGCTEPLRDADPSDRIRAEPVHVAHDKNVRKTDQRALHARGHADAQDLADHAAALPVHLAQVETAALDLAADRAVGHRHRHGLREHRGDADTRDPHIKRTDKQQVQHDIHSAGHDQNAERDIRPPERAQDARGVVVDNGEHQSGKIDAQIDQRVP